MVGGKSGEKGYGMAARGDGTIDTAALRSLTHRLGEGATSYEPAAQDTNDGLPDRTPGAALAQPARVPVGPGAIIVDCGTSRVAGYTHVFCISVSAEAMLGSHMMDSLGLMVGHVAGVESYAWEGAERLHVRAPGLGWEDLLREAQDALAVHLSSS